MHQCGQKPQRLAPAAFLVVMLLGALRVRAEAPPLAPGTEAEPPRAASALGNAGAPQTEAGDQPPTPPAASMAPAPETAIYPASPVVRERKARCDEACRQNERRLDAVRDELAAMRLGRPILGMIAGYGATLALAPAIDGILNHDRGAAIAGGVFAAGGIALGVYSNVRLVQRVLKRNRLKEEQRAIKAALYARNLPEEQRATYEARERQLRELREQYSRYRLAGPLTLMSHGYVVAVGGLLLALITKGASGSQSTFQTCLVVGLAGIPVGLAGAGWLIARVHRRGPIGQRIRELEREQRVLEQLSLSIQVGSQTGLMLRYRF